MRIGDSDDLKIYHDGTESFIKNSTDDLNIEGDSIKIRAANGEAYITCVADGAVGLRYDNNEKLVTTSAGATLTGALTTTGNVSAGNDLEIPNDSGKIKLGTSSDLQIYHDGTDTFFKNHTTGAVYHRARTNWQVSVNATDGGADDAIKALQNGAVELYYDNSKKFETLSTGWGVANTIEWHSTQGSLDVYDNKKISLGSSRDLTIDHNGSDSTINNQTGNLRIRNAGEFQVTKSSTENMLIAKPDGAVELYHNNVKKLWTESWGINIDGNLALGDSEELVFGGSDDFKIYHSSNLSTIKNTHANGLAVRSDLIMLQNDAGDHDYLTTANEAGVSLYYDNAKKLETTSAGGTLTGTWTGVGIQQYDEWILTANANTSQNPIESNWSRAAAGGNGFDQNLPIGSGMSVSSGVFTFPTTGYWLIKFHGDVRHSSGNMWTEGFIQITGNNGSNWHTVAQGYSNQYDDSNWVYGTVNTEVTMDVEDTSNDKCRFTVAFDESSNGVIIGSSSADRNATFATFTRIADT